MKQLLVILLLTSCGSDDSKTETQVITQPDYLASRSDLPECTDSNKNVLMYISDEKKFVVCDGTWETVNLKGDAGKDADPGLTILKRWSFHSDDPLADDSILPEFGALAGSRFYISDINLTLFTDASSHTSIDGILVDFTSPNEEVYSDQVHFEDFQANDDPDFSRKLSAYSDYTLQVVASLSTTQSLKTFYIQVMGPVQGELADFADDLVER